MSPALGLTLWLAAAALVAGAGPGEEAGAGRFTDVTTEAGIPWRHASGATGEKLLPETMGGGVAFLDYDGDGDPDLLFVDSGIWPAQAGGDVGAARPLAVLYANEGFGDGKVRFRDVTGETGLSKVVASPGSHSYGQGVAVGDYDGDGWPDLYLTAAGPNRLLRNAHGRFEDVTAATGTGGGDAWSTGAAFFDADGDGDLDLFVANYLEWSPALDRSEATIAERTVALAPVSSESGGAEDGEGATGLTYGRPQHYRGAHPFLFVNPLRGGAGGAFAERGEAAGLWVADGRGPVAKALAVAPADVDRDGRVDLLVANDTTRNLFFHNRTEGGGEEGGAPRFEEVGELFGLAYDANGRATGAMGIDWADLEGDGAGVSFLVGNFADEATSLYRAQGDRTVYADEAMASGLSAATRAELTFAVLLFDQDLDGRLDLLQVNGHVEPDIERVDPRQRYDQPAQLFRSAASAGSPETARWVPARWLPVAATETGDLARPIAGRGAAYADVDGDGDLDLAITRIDGGPLLLRNDQATGHHWLRLRLVDEPPSRDAIGARVAVTAGGRVQTRDVQPTRGYLSAVELPLTFGLGSAETVERVEVTWPDGSAEVFEVEGVDRAIELKRGGGRSPQRGSP